MGLLAIAGTFVLVEGVANFDFMAVGPRALVVDLRAVQAWHLRAHHPSSCSGNWVRPTAEAACSTTSSCWPSATDSS
jgi:hypothetical protein